MIFASIQFLLGSIFIGLIMWSKNDTIPFMAEISSTKLPNWRSKPLHAGLIKHNVDDINQNAHWTIFEDQNVSEDKTSKLYLSLHDEEITLDGHVEESRISMADSSLEFLLSRHKDESIE